jgi:hypothetical protein
MWVAILLVAAALAQQAPAPPPPFPRPRVQPPRPGSQPTVVPAPAPEAPSITPPPPADRGPNEATLGVPLYPGAQFISSYDAGRGQRFYLYGSAASFVDIVTFYRTTLKQKGDLVFETPATHEFDLGKFREETMAFPASVTVKDFQSQLSQGYPNPKPGGQPARFPTVIQIVPPSQQPEK